MSGETQQQALERTGDLGDIDGSVSLYDYMLPASEQQQLLQQQQELFKSPEGKTYLQWLGIGQPVFSSELQEHPLQNQFYIQWKTAG